VGDRILPFAHMKFIEHKGSLSVMMATMLEFDDIASFKAHIEGIYETPVDAIQFKLRGADKRISWPKCYLIAVDFKDVTPGCPIGWSDSILE